MIEIASPNDTRPMLANKTAIYLRAGVRLVWIVWPKSATIDVWRLASPAAPTATLTLADILDGLDVVPGFTCPVADVLRG